MVADWLKGQLLFRLFLLSSSMNHASSNSHWICLIKRQLFPKQKHLYFFLEKLVESCLNLSQLCRTTTWVVQFIKLSEIFFELDLPPSHRWTASGSFPPTTLYFQLSTFSSLLDSEASKNKMAYGIKKKKNYLKIL